MGKKETKKKKAKTKRYRNKGWIKRQRNDINNISKPKKTAYIN